MAVTCGVTPHVPRSWLWSAGGRLKAVYAVLVLVSSAPFVHRTECHVSVMGLDKAGWWFVVSLVDWSSARGGVTNTLPVKWAPRKSVNLGITLHRVHVVLPRMSAVAVDGSFPHSFSSLSVHCIQVLFSHAVVVCSGNERTYPLAGFWIHVIFLYCVSPCFILQIVIRHYHTLVCLIDIIFVWHS